MIFATTVLALAAVTPLAHEPDVCDHVTRNVWDPKFTPGQRWSYRSRPVDAGSTLIITKIDDVPGIGVVVHIDVDNVDFFDLPPTPRGNNTGSQHIAIKRDSLDASVLEVLGIIALSNDSSSYLRWHMNCIGLTYSTTVADTLTALQWERCTATAQKNTRTAPACAAGRKLSTPSTPRLSPIAMPPSPPPAPIGDSSPRPQPPD
jgi:hypothetical protein